VTRGRRLAGRKVFISYARADGAFVDELVQGLVDAGHDPWIDVEDIVSGSWAASIVEAIRKSDVAVVVLTPTSVGSRNVLQEVRLAAKNRVPLIPVIVYPPPEIPPDFEYHIVGQQRVDARLDMVPSAVRSLVMAVEGSETGPQRRGWRTLRNAIGGAVVLGAIVFGVATVATGHIPPWAPTPACASVNASVSAEAAEFVTLRGAVLDIAFVNDAERQVGLPPSDRVSVVGSDGNEYRHEPGLAGSAAWFLSESISPGATRALKLGIAGDGRGSDTVTVRVPGVSEQAIPFLQCEVVIEGVGVDFAQ
jgi:hypothetical protein